MNSACDSGKITPDSANQLRPVQPRHLQRLTGGNQHLVTCVCSASRKVETMEQGELGQGATASEASAPRSRREKVKYEQTPCGERWRVAYFFFPDSFNTARA